MKHYQKVFLQLFIAVTVWLLLVFEIVPGKSGGPYWFQTTVNFLPFIMLVLLGVYSGLYVLYGTLTFNDCEDAYIALKRDVAEAEEFLTKNGIRFSDKYNAMSKKTQ